MTNQEHAEKQFYDRETKAQRWRRLTPLGMVANLATNFVGTGMIIGLLVFIIQGFEKRFDLQNGQNVQIWASINEVRTQEATDAKCLTKEVFQCCGEKANASC